MNRSLGKLRSALGERQRQLIASTPLLETEETTPVQIMPWTHIDRISWWLPNEAAFRHWFLAAGFSSVDVEGITRLRSDKEFREMGRVVNPDQALRVGRATV